LVLTPLTKKAMPVIRYRTGDLTRLLPGEAGPMRRMARIGGRTDDMLIVRGVNLFPSQIEEAVLRCPGLSPHFAIELSRPDRLDRLAVEAEARADLPAGQWEEQSHLLAIQIRETIGLGAEVRIAAPGTIARSDGKARRVRDLRPK
jgi:phenylacetate-CoA ligase